MGVNLTVMRERHEGRRLERLRRDDSRTAIAPEAARALAADLRKAVEGEIRFDDGTRAMYATDASNYRQVPIGVVIPRHTGDVATTVELCRRHGAPVLSRGGGTSLAGQCCNVAVVMDFTKYLNRVLAIDPGRKLGTVEPGCILDTLQAKARPHDLIFGPDPSTHTHCALGGMLGNNSCGAHSLIAKNDGLGLRTSDCTHELEVLTYQGDRFRVGPTPPEELERIISAGGRRGEIYRKLAKFVDEYADDIRKGFPKLARRVSGYNLDDLLPENGFHVARALVGSEGTLVTFLEATMHLSHKPRARTMLVLGYSDIYTGAEHIARILDFRPTALEGMDDALLSFVKEKGTYAQAIQFLPEGDGWLFAEFGGETQEQADENARRCAEALGRADTPPDVRTHTGDREVELLWKLRESGLGATAFVPKLPDTWPGWEDTAVPVGKIAPYMRDLRGLLEKFDYHAVSMYGHFGQGLIHCRIPFDLYTQPGIDKYLRFTSEAADLVVRYGGSLSGEHGDGQARAAYLPRMFGPRLVEAFREFKRIWDPLGKMNPGKVIDANDEAYGPAENLRLGSDYDPPPTPTHFKYPADEFNYARAPLRCVGVGKCRREEGGTMCPSYMVTREEKHSTRGRAHLLWEMLNGELLADGWRSEAVHDALDLCLACKGCKGDCPVNVDIATYKAEFLSHYYQGRLRPRHMFAFGFIHLWSRLASVAPGLVNFFTQTPGVSAVAKWLAGMDHRRAIPPFAPHTFRQWFNARRPRNPEGDRVVLFADTFNNYYSTDAARAAVEVLEHAGFNVTVPAHDICCGRPLYDYGFLDMARRRLLDILDKLRPAIEAGVPVVMLEPSCWSVLVDELPNLLPHHEDGKRLRDSVYLLGNFLETRAPEYEPPQLRRRALLHRHCHHKSELKNDKSDENLLKRMGVESREPETGCCGMAGAFGYEPGAHYDVSVACGERVLLPEVRTAAQEEVLIADGFSCREQISQSTGRDALHLAQVIQMALSGGPGSGRPEAPVVRARRSERRAAARRAGVSFAAGAALGAAAVWAARRGVSRRE